MVFSQPLPLEQEVSKRFAIEQETSSLMNFDFLISKTIVWRNAKHDVGEVVKT